MSSDDDDEGGQSTRRKLDAVILRVNGRELEVLNVSAHGVLFRYPGYDGERGDQLTTSFTIPADGGFETFNLDGEVISNDDGLVACAYLHRVPEWEEALQRLLPQD